MKEELQKMFAWIRDQIQANVTSRRPTIFVALALVIVVALTTTLFPPLAIALLLVIFVMVILVVFLTIVGIQRLSRLGVIFTTQPEEGTTAFVVAGEKLLDIWPNILGHKLSAGEDLRGNNWIVPAKDEDDRMQSFFRRASPNTLWLQQLLWQKFGLRYISIFLDQIRIGFFKISRKVILEKSEVAQGASLLERVQPSKDQAPVSNLLHMIPRPVAVTGLDLPGDNSKINILLYPIFRQIIPALPVFYYKGEFFPIVDAAIEAVMVDFCATHRVAVYKEGARKGEFAKHTYELPIDKEDEDNEAKQREYENTYLPAPLTYQFWLMLPKASTAGTASPIERAFRGLNISRSFIETLKAAAEVEINETGDSDKIELVEFAEALAGGEFADPAPGSKTEEELPSGLVPRIGLALDSLRLIETEINTASEALATALSAKETQRHVADGVRQEAYGRRDAALAQVQAARRQFEDLPGALKDHGVDPNIAAGVLETLLRTENIGGADSKILTYVEGGGSASVMVPTTPPAPIQPKGDPQ